jgi:hypothetical protein
MKVYLPQDGGKGDTTKGEIDLGENKLSTGTGTESGGAVTINQVSGIITTSSLSTAADSATNITLTNSKIKATSVVIASVGAYSGTIGTNGHPLLDLLLLRLLMPMQQML